MRGKPVLIETGITERISFLRERLEIKNRKLRVRITDMIFQIIL
jgi:hypothetical protein